MEPFLQILSDNEFYHDLDIAEQTLILVNANNLDAGNFQLNFDNFGQEEQDQIPLDQVFEQKFRMTLQTIFETNIVQEKIYQCYLNEQQYPIQAYIEKKIIQLSNYLNMFSEWEKLSRDLNIELQIIFEEQFKKYYKSDKPNKTAAAIQIFIGHYSIYRNDSLIQKIQNQFSHLLKIIKKGIKRFPEQFKQIVEQFTMIQVPKIIQTYNFLNNVSYNEKIQDMIRQFGQTIIAYSNHFKNPFSISSLNNTEKISTIQTEEQKLEQQQENYLKFISFVFDSIYKSIYQQLDQNYEIETDQEVIEDIFYSIFNFHELVDVLKEDWEEGITVLNFIIKQMTEYTELYSDLFSSNNEAYKFMLYVKKTYESILQQQDLPEEDNKYQLNNQEKKIQKYKQMDEIKQKLNQIFQKISEIQQLENNQKIIIN
ncbi:hypothetical protein PPERSA_05427 [Pseudocohnilembus persalinus]|uniref:Uncharacterized protein n=1 Tax=Pseudocohnilembus persalinus TaxID=266149 RepID=A0A0V0R7Z1_PSEPJ|nr:hypothetical protein PPERSA_05427 [Pseudocohnilembus persalinus]|eukprot:KRX10607.1 hypothetical protein PPERSA_05427 [Pseudocohnilembus persalinus]